MFKKVLQAATAFGLLLAGYAAYRHGFALVARGFAQASRGPAAGARTGSANVRKAMELAASQFGRNHWAAAENLQIKIYNAERGFWMFARDYKRLGDGRRLEFRPFAVISESRDGKNYKTVTADSAVIDLDKPLGLISKPGSGGNLHVVHARLEGEVRIRDDKGTPDVRDDLRVGPLTYLEYDEPGLQIVSESGVVIEDNVYRITGRGLQIKLRPREDGPPTPGSTAGFNGAQTAFLRKEVHIVISDVGPAGILPGNPDAPRTPGEKTPLDLRCDGQMRIDLPRPTATPRVGPPAPAGPTLAQFVTNVEVLRGKPGATPDQLNCDTLRLTLVPADKAASATPTPDSGPGLDADGAPTGEGGQGANLTLRRAVASGHNVRLVSAAQGVKARCNELIHNKLFPAAPDETYLRGDPTTPVFVEKEEVAQDGPGKGTVSSYTTIRTIDATIFDDGQGQGNDNATIVAHGPGEMEVRPAPNQPVERTARWLDQLVIQPEAAPAAPKGVPAPAGKRITLTGNPSFRDLRGQTSLDARRTTVIYLKPRPPAPKTDPAAQKAGAFDIEKLVALGDVLLKSPGKTLTARERLDAVFEPVPGPAPAATAPKAAAPAATGTGTGEPAKAAPGAPAPEAPARPAEPEARAVANRVWARVLMRPSDKAAPAGSGLAGLGAAGGQTPDIDRVYLRGRVSVHQAPQPGKAKGTDVVGEAVDLVSQGVDPVTQADRGSRFIVYHRERKTPAAGARPKADPDDDRAPLAKVETEDMTILGKVIGLDQSTDQAWVDGRGSLTQLASAGLLSDKAPAKPAAVPPAKKGPMTVSFARGMKFFGRSTDLNGRPAARAEFYQDVHAVTDEATLDCREVMKTYLDKTVKLIRPKGDPKAEAPGELPGPVEPSPEIALIECVKDVVVVNRKLYPGTDDLMQKQRIEGEYLVYEKATGQFRVPGAGEVYLYERDGQGGLNAAAPGIPGEAARRPIRPMAGPASRPSGSPAPAPAAAPGGRNVVRVPGDRPRARPPLPPLVITQVHFAHEMRGRFGSGKDADKAETRWADFFGDVEALHGRVPDEDAIIDPDDRPADAQFITAQTMRVISEPQPRGPGRSAVEPPPRYLLRAWENSYVASDDKTIQADTVTYDSLTDLFYAYGEDGRNVVIAQQDKIGQPATVVEGRAAKYNAKTGQSELIEPRSIAAVDGKTGYRPTPQEPNDPKVKPKRQERSKFRNLRGNVERKDFTGR